jgi:hypothetical protein
VSHPLVRLREARFTVNVRETAFRTAEVALGSIHVRIHVVVRRDYERVARKGVAAPEAGSTWGIARLDRKLGHQILDHRLVKPPFLGLRLLKNVRVLQPPSRRSRDIHSLLLKIKVLPYPQEKDHRGKLHSGFLGLLCLLSASRGHLHEYGFSV